MKKTTGEGIFALFNSILMVLLCIIIIYPYINQIAISLNEGADTLFGGITLYPRRFTLVNYYTVLSNVRFKNALLISVLRVILTTALALFVTTSAAYAISNKNLPGRNVFIWFLIIPMYISAGLIPIFILYRYLHLINNFLVYIVPGLFSFYNMIIVRTFLQSIPVSLEESAVIDGANEFIVLFYIIIPLSMPALATVALWVAVGNWNDWTTTLLFVTKGKLNTIQFLLQQVVKESEMAQKMASEVSRKGSTTKIGTTPEAVKATTLIISTLPIVILYPFLQKYFVKGVVIGAVKE